MALKPVSIIFASNRAYQNFIRYIYIKNTLPFLNYDPLKLHSLRALFSGHTVVMVSYCVTKIIAKFTNCWAAFFIACL